MRFYIFCILLMVSCKTRNAGSLLEEDGSPAKIYATITGTVPLVDKEGKKVNSSDVRIYPSWLNKAMGEDETDPYGSFEVNAAGEFTLSLTVTEVKAKYSQLLKK